MVRRSPALRKRVKRRPGANTLYVEDTASRFVPLGADSKTLDGLNPHCVLIDETHAHRDRGVYDVLKTAFGSRRQPLLMAITTAGVYDPSTIGWELHDFAVKVLEGSATAEWLLAYIAAADEDDDWRDPETWKKANPNYGVSFKPTYIREQFEKADETPSFENTFKRLHLNLWTEQVDRWLQMERWEECDRPRPAEDLSGGFGGLDLASLNDIIAFVAVFPDGDAYDVLCRFWVTEDAVRRAEKSGRVPYAAWVRDGHLNVAGESRYDYGTIVGEVSDLCHEHNIRQVGYDPWNAEKVRQELEGEGLEMVELRQGVKTLGEPTKELESLVTAGLFRHGRNPVLRWMASNVAVREDSNGNIKPDRKASQGKIDGVVASIMALNRAMYNDVAGPSRWESDDAELMTL